MLKTIKMVAAYASFFSMKNKLHNASDDYWRQKIGDRALALDGRVLNPRAQAMIEFQEQLTVSKKYWTPQLVRKGFDKSAEFFDGRSQPIAQVEDVKIPVKDHMITMRHYSNDASKKIRSCIMFFHGGGFVIGSLAGYDKFCRKLALQSKCDVLSVEYRLAPEHKFPAALDDAISSWQWLQENFSALHIDPANVAVAGDSAGAFLALLVSTEASKSETENRPSAMGLIYPPVFTSEISNSRRLLGDEKIVLNKDLLEWFMGHFLPTDVSYDDSRFAVLETAQKGRMPPTWILTCGFDPLRDDGEKIADVLTGLGAEVSLQEYKDMYHGFITLSGIFPQVQTMIHDMAGFLLKHSQTAPGQQEIAAE